MSQENVSDKVRNLQRQIAQSIKFGQKPPSQRRSEGDDGSSDEEELPQSPLKVEAQMEASPAEPQPTEVLAAQPPQGVQQHAHVTQQAQVQAHSTPVRSPRSRRVLPPDGTIESINLDSVPLSGPRLDNTAAKHKLSVKPKNQRVSRKHRRFTQDLQEVSLPGVLQEEEAEGGQQRTAAEEPPYGSPETSKKQRLQEEERRESRRRREQEEHRLRREEEERCRKQQEEQRLRKEEEERRQAEEAARMRREEEERLRREEEERLRREEEERLRREEDRRRQEEQERRRREEEEARRKREEEEERKRLEEQRREEEERKRREEEDEARRRLELEKRLREEEEERQRIIKEEMEVKIKLEAEERRKVEEEEQKPSQERKRRAEELRWREMEERQRPFSFKVSSGEKQILFQKVNLTPVAAPSGNHSGPAAEPVEGVKTSSSEGGDSHLPSSQYVPHTAILVTGAQLCGTAVQMDQIKDTACKSLLGLGEDKRAMGSPLAKGKISPDRKSAKTKSLTETTPATDQSSAAVLAEWASIRSKIFKGAEEGKYDDYPESGRNQTRPISEDLNQSPFSHTNLRKTMSANAKFSITPAKKKFGDSNRNSELLSVDVRDGGKDVSTSEGPCISPTTSPGPGGKAPSKAAKTVRIAERGSEECMFAKDLPSFLVPKAEAAEVKNGSQGEAEDSDYNEEEEEEDRGPEGGEDKPSPFGIKLRRTNYSLRFHSEQSTEKRKKRYSAGDSFDGVPSPLTPIEPDSDCSSVFSDKSSPVSPRPESAYSRLSHAAASPAVLRAKSGRSHSATAMHGEGEKAFSKPPLYQRPAVSPKPATPPPSPLPKTVRGVSSDASAQRVGESESPVQDQAEQGEEPSSAVAQLRRSSHVSGDEEPKEKKSFFPSINIPWREKTDRKTELLRKEKPSLQSRHSLDSSRASEKEVGPLWITLALQKQKGFREQQQSRDDRRSQREAKLAEKQSRDKDGATLGSPTDNKVDRSPSPKPQTPEEPNKRPDSLLGRFDRRDPLKKANTLPSSVTVEISDSTPSPPSKEVSKRFPSSDSPQSTEPAWLALAKRKAKAWSDCPQIIK